jgi:hypothetical protein
MLLNIPSQDFPRFQLSNTVIEQVYWSVKWVLGFLSASRRRDHDFFQAFLPFGFEPR